MSELSLPSLEAFQEARQRISGVVRHTPLVPAHERLAAPDVYLKLETMQPVGSFKIRGIYNAVSVLSDAERAKGVSTVSAGNTAQALAWAATRFGVPSRSLMPDTAPKTKIDAVRAYGVEPVLVPVAEVFRFLKEHGWESEPYAFIHPWTNADVMTGHGSLGLEILEDLPDVDSVFIPVGGGGLLGVGAALEEARAQRLPRTSREPSKWIAKPSDGVRCLTSRHRPEERLGARSRVSASRSSRSRPSRSSSGQRGQPSFRNLPRRRIGFGGILHEALDIGSGLLTGVGAALKTKKPELRIFAVEPEGCPALHESLKAGRPVEVDCQTLCDGVAVPYITDEMFPRLHSLVDEARLVSEERVRAVIRALALDNKLVVEGSGALALAAALAEAPAERGRAVCIVTGGSIDAGKLAAILADESLSHSL